MIVERMLVLALPAGLLFIVLDLLTLNGCKTNKDGIREYEQAVVALQNAKSYRARWQEKGAQGLWEVVCPDRVHFLGPLPGSPIAEQITIGQTEYIRMVGGPWMVGSLYSQNNVPCGQSAVLLAGHREISRDYEFRYGGSLMVDGQKCENWIARKRYEIVRLEISLCINPMNHRLLQEDSGDGSTKKYYDFDENITIIEPETASESDLGKNLNLQKGPQ